MNARCLHPCILALALLVLPGLPGLPSASEPAGLELPPETRSLLIREMNAILDASQAILGALVRGRDDIVAAKAQAIHDHFVMDEAMTAAARKRLRELLPGGFLQRDRAFHRLAGELAEAAREGDRRRQREGFGRMIQACIGCHSRYAVDRFPGLKR